MQALSSGVANGVSDAVAGMARGGRNFLTGTANALTQPGGIYGSALGIPNPFAIAPIQYDNARQASYGSAMVAGLTGSSVVVGGAVAAESSVSVVPETASLTNPVSTTLARVIPGQGPFPTLAPPGRVDAFVTAAEDIRGLNAAQLGPRLGIQNSTTFTVIEFPTPSSGLASPVFRSDPGFVGFGRTSGGAREFVVPNGPIPSGAIFRRVQ